MIDDTKSILSRAGTQFLSDLGGAACLIVIVLGFLNLPQFF